MPGYGGDTCASRDAPEEVSDVMNDKIYESLQSQLDSHAKALFEIGDKLDTLKEVVRLQEERSLQMITLLCDLCDDGWNPDGASSYHADQLRQLLT